MKRHLNTSYRLVWNHITGTLVVASELARSRGKRTGVAVALSLAAVTSVPVLAADTVVQAGETVSGGTLTNHDNQIVLGTANGMTISTGLEYGPDNEANTGGQWIQNGGTANNTTVTGGGLQRVNAGGSVSDTVISAGGGQSLQGQAVNTTLNGGEQWVHEGGIATGIVPDEQRISFWPQHFGLIPQWVALEPRVFGWMDRLCEDYCGGIWNLYTLNNGGAFMAPEPDDDDDETWVLFNAMNGNRAEMSPEAAGIAACLMTYSHHACRTECYAMTVHYYRLRDYALQHPECSAIMRIID
ncbi:hypothetical protein FYK42_14240 [Escherichia coli]|nr:hypothetical protein FYK42_14240 [Escherichia coli]